MSFLSLAFKVGKVAVSQRDSTDCSQAGARSQEPGVLDGWCLSQMSFMLKVSPQTKQKAVLTEVWGQDFSDQEKLAREKQSSRTRGEKIKS